MTADHGAAPLQCIVMGGGVAGLGSALALSRAGHLVTVLERDATPLPADPDHAFDWNRRGAPQVRHSHALLARLRNLLRDRYPDVLARLLDAGATEMRFAEMMPDTIDDPTPVPEDEDLVALACRRTTFEWVLRHAVLDDPNVRLLDGHAAEGLVIDRRPDGRPWVRGVVVTDGDGSPVEHRADLVIAANGRRSPIAAWLAAAGTPLDVEEEDTGIVYLSRFYRLCDGAVPPDQSGPIGGDLGYLKYAIFQGDNRTFSVTFAVRTHDDELRSRLLDPDRFDAAARALPATAAWADPALAEPLTPVHVMAGLINRAITFTSEDGRPLVPGLHAVGDAHTCTNPLYGRGCSLALVQAALLADATAAHGADHDERGRAYEEACAREIAPWYQAARQQDRMARDAAAREREAKDGTGGAADPEAADPPGTDAAGTDADPAAFMRDLLIDGVMPALRLHASVFRAFVRMFNLLDRPDALFTDAEVLARVMEVYQARDERDPEPPLGPPRREMLALL